MYKNKLKILILQLTPQHPKTSWELELGATLPGDYWQQVLRLVDSSQSVHGTAFYSVKLYTGSITLIGGYHRYILM